MRTFEYCAFDARGAAVAGRTSAGSELELDRELESKGWTLRSARVVASEARRKGQKLGRADLISFTTQLSTLIAAGVPMFEGLTGVGGRMPSAQGRALVAAMVAGLQGGKSLSQVMDEHPAAFPNVYRATVRAGEASGALDRVLDRLAKYIEWSSAMRATTIQALIYPAILMGAIFGLILVLLYYLLPRIIKLFPGGREALPVQTRIVLSISDFLRGNALWLGLGALAVVTVVTWALRKEAGQRYFHERLLALPKVGRLVQQIATSRFASTAGILQSAGCDVFTVLGISGESCGNAAMAAAFKRGAEAIRKGSTIADGLEKERHVDPMLKQMIYVGEKSGQLDRCLNRLVEYYDEEIPRSVKRFLALLEPALLLCAGAVVAFILLAALMPIFDLYQKV